MDEGLRENMEPYSKKFDSIVYGVLKKNLDGINNLNEHFKKAIVKIPVDLK